MAGNFDFGKFRKPGRLAPNRKPGARRQRGYVNADGFCVFFALAVALGVALAYGIPWLWSIVKPLIHAATA